MIIGIDGNEANVKNRVGVNVYAYELLSAMHKLQDKVKNNNRFIVYLKAAPLHDMPEETPWWKYEVLTGKGPWVITQLTPYLFLNKEKPEIFFSPNHYTMPVHTIPRVCSIMDLGYLEFSGQFKRHTFWQLKYWSAISIYVSKYIIAISNATKEDIVRHYPHASGKISVTLLAHDKDRFNTNISSNDVRRIKKKYSIVDDYVLYIGTLKPSKNVEGLVDAYKMFLNNYKAKNPPQLVIAGKKGWMFESIFEKVKKLGIKDLVVFTDFFDDKEKPALLAGAKVLASPSYWEGFGLHALESMACGTPVVASKAGSLTEIIADAGIYIDPDDHMSIAKGLEKVLKMSEKEYNILVEKGIKQADKFSWEETAKMTVKILEGAT